MRVMMVGMHTPGSSGGLDRYFEGLGEALYQRAPDLRGLAFRFGEGESPGWVGIVGQASLGLPRRAKLLREAFGAWRAEGSRQVGEKAVVVSHFSLYAFLLQGMFRGFRHVVHFHGPWADESAEEGSCRSSAAVKRWIEKRVYRGADHLVVLSDAFRDILSDRYGIDRSKISVIPGGIDPGRFPMRDRGESRQRFGWDPDAPTVVCVRRLARRMGLENLITAFAEVPKQFPAARLMIGGKGPLKEELQALINSLGLVDRVTLLGFVPDGDLPYLYSAADFSIVPSQALEGFGLITLESLACGTPVIVTPVGGLPDGVKGLDPGLVLPSSGVRDLADGMTRAIAHPESLPTREACRRHVVEGFSWDMIASRVWDAYSKVR